MGAAIGDILGSAVGVAISPVPVIAVILILFSAKPTANGLSFLLGWIIGLTIAGGIVLALGLTASDGTASDLSGWIKIAIGLLFLFLGWKDWSSRPRGDEQATMPEWMSTINEFNSGKSFAAGFVLSALNPKNLGLTVAAMASVSAAGLSTGEEIGTLLIFVLIASLTVAAPVVMTIIMGSKATKTLTEMQHWLVANNKVVMTVLFVVIGAKVLGAGIAIVA